jgi:CheY-like chemotaxis protein
MIADRVLLVGGRSVRLTLDLINRGCAAHPLQAKGSSTTRYVQSITLKKIMSSTPDPASGAFPRLDRTPVLVIEDDDDAREVLVLSLTTCGAAVSQAASGEEGLALLEGTEVLAVVCDVGLPGIDGFEVARRLRASNRHRGVRLIAVTGFGRTEDVRRAEEAGFDAHLTKPVETDRLVLLLRELTAAASGS